YEGSLLLDLLTYRRLTSPFISRGCAGKSTAHPGPPRDDLPSCPARLAAPPVDARPSMPSIDAARRRRAPRTPAGGVSMGPRTLGEPSGFLEAALGFGSADRRTLARHDSADQPADLHHRLSPFGNDPAPADAALAPPHRVPVRDQVRAHLLRGAARLRRPGAGGEPAQARRVD